MKSSNGFSVVRLIAIVYTTIISIYLIDAYPAKANLAGATVSIGGYCCDTPTAPDLFTNIITGAVPVFFPEGSLVGASIIPSSFDVTADQIIQTSFVSALAAPGSFNGPVYDFSGLSAPITDVTVDPLSTRIPVSVTFTADSIAVDNAGLSVSAGSKIILDVTTGGVTPGVPEPSTWAMMLIGFTGLGFASYRASRKSVPLS